MSDEKTLVPVEVLEKDAETKAKKNEINELVLTAKEVQITSIEDVESAGEILAKLAIAKDAIEERRKFFTQPLNDQLKNINSFFKEVVAPFAEGDKVLREKVLEFRKNEAKKRKESDDPIGLPKTIGRVTASEAVKFRVSDEEKLPEKYWRRVPDEELIKLALKRGEDVPGVEVISSESLSVRKK